MKDVTTSHSILLTAVLAPLGFLSHIVTCFLHSSWSQGTSASQQSGGALAGAAAGASAQSTTWRYESPPPNIQASAGSSAEITGSEIAAGGVPDITSTHTGATGSSNGNVARGGSSNRRQRHNVQTEQSQFARQVQERQTAQLRQGSSGAVSSRDSSTVFRPAQRQTAQPAPSRHGSAALASATQQKQQSSVKSHPISDTKETPPAKKQTQRNKRNGSGPFGLGGKKGRTDGKYKHPDWLIVEEPVYVQRKPKA